MYTEFVVIGYVAQKTNTGTNCNDGLNCQFLVPPPKSTEVNLWVKLGKLIFKQVPQDSDVPKKIGPVGYVSGSQTKLHIVIT